MIRTAKDLGDLVRRKRKHLNLTQDELAARCGFGKRFILELEAGKPSCQLEKALIAAYEVGIRLDDRDPESIAAADIERRGRPPGRSAEVLRPRWTSTTTICRWRKLGPPATGLSSPTIPIGSTATAASRFLSQCRCRPSALGQRRSCPWLANLLPETHLSEIGQQIGVSPQDILGILGAIGRDTAGALAIGRPRERATNFVPSKRKATSSESSTSFPASPS